MNTIEIIEKITTKNMKKNATLEMVYKDIEKCLALKNNYSNDAVIMQLVDIHTIDNYIDTLKLYRDIEGNILYVEVDNSSNKKCSLSNGICSLPNIFTDEQDIEFFNVDLLHIPMQNNAFFKNDEIKLYFSSFTILTEPFL